MVSSLVLNTPGPSYSLRICTLDTAVVLNTPGPTNFLALCSSRILLAFVLVLEYSWS